MSIRSVLDRLVSRSSVAIVLMISACGCGGDGLQRYRVTGDVTYKGKPVEAGMIFFEPAESAGAVAPTCYLAIKDGKYDAGSEGPTKGKYRVTVGGMDRANEKKGNDGMVHTPSLFPDYKFEVDIPPPDNKLDIEVPDTKSK